jgi:Caspase domain/Putative peptidoglycan binding domain
MRRTSLFAAAIALALVCTPVLSDTAWAQKRVALVIGNSAYKNVPGLPNPTRDAKAMAEKFKEAGFVVVKTNYDLAYLEFKRAIRDFEDAAADADIIVVYYAGHGIEVDGTNYVIPVDARLASTRDAQDEAVTLDRLLEASEGAKQLSLVILDACRDNPFVRMKPKRTASVMRSVKVTAGMGGVEPVTSNTLIYYAARKNSGAEDGMGEHSPFTSALLKHLFTPGQDIRFAFGKVRDDVMKETENKQEPYVTGTFGSTLISLNPAPAPKAAELRSIDLEKVEKDHYELVKEVGSVKAWKVFLLQHPNGFYAGLAKEQIEKLEKLALATPEKLPGKPEPTTEEQRAWDRIKESSNPVWFEDFIKRYPTSPLADLAQNRLDAIHQQAREREEKARLEREAKAAEEARQKAEREAALKRAEEERKAKAAEAARQKAEREAALKRDEEERLAKLAAEEARKKAEREVARKREEEERQVKAAEAARLKAEREAALKLEEEERRAKAATEAERLRVERETAAKRAEEERQTKAAEAARLKAEREAALKLQEEERRAKAATEAERARIEREAALKRAEEEKAAKAADNERLKAEREAALRRAEDERKRTEEERKAKMVLVRSAQTELARLGCYRGSPDGELGPGTREAIKQYQIQRGHTLASITEVTDGFVSELKGLPERICVAAPPPSIAPVPVAKHEPPEKVRPATREEEPAPPRRATREEPPRRATREEPPRRATREEPPPRRASREETPRRASREEPRRTRPTREVSAPRYGGGGGGGGGHGPIGVGF